MMSEEKVLKKLDIVDFRHLTKDKVIKMASMLDKMNPEVAKKALEQFPEFANTTKEMLTEYKESLDEGLESNNKSVKAVYDTYNAVITSLQKELEKENLTFEQKKYIIEQMKDVAEKVDKKDTENKRFIAGMATLAAIVVSSTVVVLASALGGNTQIKPDDTDKAV
ncbi:hypothetical protein [Anaerobutyricum hallii]|uniref:Uncharacterized protein n=1 Tax=Anaerobutyricum hallii TaxID=39488 RepID=A0A415UEF4_9FIRM|nr:hypothetical protein [Anaerobutyricum hallii]RHN16518.1 hypothetical protein DWZ29_02890 [Anaerobutyricum hallii]